MNTTSLKHVLRPLALVFALALLLAGQFGTVHAQAQSDGCAAVNWRETETEPDLYESLGFYGFMFFAGEVITVKVSEPTLGDPTEFYFTVNDEVVSTGPLPHTVSYTVPSDGVIYSIEMSFDQGAASFDLACTPILTEKNQCKNGGWKMFNNPSFKNQGECIAYVQSGS